MSAETRQRQQDARLEAVNRFIRTVGDSDRQFFSYKGQFSRFEYADNRRLWWVDRYPDPRTGKRPRLYAHRRWWGSRFSNGGTLQAIARDLAQYIVHGTPAPTHLYSARLWAVPEDQITKILSEGRRLGIFEEGRG